MKLMHAGSSVSWKMFYIFPCSSIALVHLKSNINWIHFAGLFLEFRFTNYEHSAGITCTEIRDSWWTLGWSRRCPWLSCQYKVSAANHHYSPPAHFRSAVQKSFLKFSYLGNLISKPIEIWECFLLETPFQSILLFISNHKISKSIYTVIVCYTLQ